MQENAGAVKRASLLRSAAVMSLVTVGSRVLGLVREQVRAHYLGTSLASDAFGLAFQIPNLLRRLVAEGAMSAGFIPVLSEVEEREGRSAALVFANRYFNFVLWSMVLITALGMAGASGIVGLFALLGGREVAPEAELLTASLTRWMFPYILFVALAAVAQGVLNTYRVFWVSAASTIAMNLAVIVAAIGLAGRMEEKAYAFAIGVLVGGALQFLVQIPQVLKLGVRWRPDFRLGPGIRRALWLLVPTLFGAGVYQINVMISQAIAWGLGGGAVSALQYSSRLLELTLGVFAVAISTVVLPSLSKDVAGGRLDEVRDTILYAVRLTCFVCFPMMAALLALRTETTSLLFERGRFDALSTQATADAMAFHLLGLLHIALGRVFVPVFYAFKDTRTPVWTGVAAMIVNVVACYALAPMLSQGGIALANTLSALVQTMLLAMLLRRHLGPIRDATTSASVGKTGIATAGMLLTILALQRALGTDALRGGQLALPYLLITLGAVTAFVGAAAATQHPELVEVSGLLGRKLARLRAR